MILQIKKLSPYATVPVYSTAGSAAFDFFVPDDMTYCIPPGAHMMVGSGLAFAIPAGHVMLLFSRSGHGAKHSVSLSNSVGVIDSDYRGEVIGAIRNEGLSQFTLNPGDRYMQGIVMPYPQTSFELLGPGAELPATDRGAGGFGSTDTPKLQPRTHQLTRTTHTLATMDVPPIVYDYVKAALARASYSHAVLDDGLLDMSGIALARESE